MLAHLGACSTHQTAGCASCRLQVEVTWHRPLNNHMPSLLLLPHSVPQYHKLAMLRYARCISALVHVWLLHTAIAHSPRRCRLSTGPHTCSGRRQQSSKALVHFLQVHCMVIDQALADGSHVLGQGRCQVPVEAQARRHVLALLSVEVLVDQRWQPAHQASL